MRRLLKVLRTCSRGPRSYNRLQFNESGWLGPWDPELEDLEPTQQAIETSMNARWRKVRELVRALHGKGERWVGMILVFGCTNA